jgi:hypothetical protein
MHSKSRRNLSSEVIGSSGLQIFHDKSMEKETLTHRTMDKESKSNLEITSSSHRKIRVMRRKKRTLESGVSSKKFPAQNRGMLLETIIFG